MNVLYFMLVFKECKIGYSNVIANVTQRLIRLCRKFATHGEVLCSIVKHVAAGKRQRQFRVSKSDIEMIKATFKLKA